MQHVQQQNPAPPSVIKFDSSNLPVVMEDNYNKTSRAARRLGCDPDLPTCFLYYTSHVILSHIQPCTAGTCDVGSLMNVWVSGLQVYYHANTADLGPGAMYVFSYDDGD